MKGGSAAYLLRSFKYPFTPSPTTLFFPPLLHLHLLPFPNTLKLPMATRASQSKFDQHRFLTGGTDGAPSNVTNKKEGMSTFISVYLFHDTILTICLQVLMVFHHGSQRRRPYLKKVSRAAKTYTWCETYK